MPGHRDPATRTRKPPPLASGPPRPTTGAFAAPNALTGAKPPPPPKPPAKPPAHPVFDSGPGPHMTAVHKEAARKLLAAHDARIIASRTADQMAGVVGAMHGLPAANSPFAGVPKEKGATPTPASSPYVPDDTARAIVAAANLERLKTGGILTKPQRMLEAVGHDALIHSTKPQGTFQERHDLRYTPMGDLTTPYAPPAPAEHPHVQRDNGLQAPPEQRVQPGYGRGGQPNNPQVAPASHDFNPFDYASKGLGAAVSAAAAIPGTLTTPIHPGETHTPAEAAKPGFLAPSMAEAAGKLTKWSAETSAHVRSSELPTSTIPKDAVRVKDVRPSDGSGVSSADAASNQPVPIDQLGAVGFTPEYAATLMKMALGRGWYAGELDGLNGLDLLKHAWNDPPHGVLGWAERLGRNAAGDVATTAAAGVGLYGIGHEIATGHSERLLGELAGAGMKAGGAFLQDPTSAPGELARWAASHPYYAATSLSGAGKTLGAIGELRRFTSHVPGERILDTHLPAANPHGVAEFADGHPAIPLHSLVTGAPEPTGNLLLHRGEYSRNFYTASGQWVADQIARLGFGTNHAIGGRVDRIVRKMVNEHGHDHMKRQIAYNQARQKVGRKRAEVLLHYAMSGGKPATLLGYFELIAQGDSRYAKVAAGVAKTLREKVIPTTRELTPNDMKFLLAHEDLSRHTSQSLIHMGAGFGETGMIYRQHEPLIFATAHEVDSRGMPTPAAERAIHLLQLRHDAHADVPDVEAAHARRGGKITEAERTSAKAMGDYQAQTPKVDEPRPVQPPVIRAERDAHAARTRKWEMTRQKLHAAVVAERNAHAAAKKKWAEARARLTAKKPTLELPKLVLPVEGKRAPGLKGPSAAHKAAVASARAAHKAEVDSLKAAHETKLAAWQKRLDAHDAKKPVKPTLADTKYGKHLEKKPVLSNADTVANAARLKKHAATVQAWERRRARAQGQQEGARKAVDRADRRAAALREADAAQRAATPDLTDIQQQYHDAVRAFAQEHLDSGGLFTPHRVAYQKVASHPRAPTVRLASRIGFKSQAERVKHSTGHTFMSGNFLIDHRSPLRDSIRAQRMRTSMGVHRAVVDEMGVRAHVGDERPKGTVFVKLKNLTSLGQMTHHLEDNVVSHADHYSGHHYKQEASIRDRLTTRLEGANATDNSRATADRTNDFAAEDGYFVPEAAWHRMLDYTRPESRNAYDTAMRQYQRTLISIFPSTLIGNTLGTLPLAVAAGARGRAFKEAARANQWGNVPGARLFGHSHHLGDPTLAPSALFGKGNAGAFSADTKGRFTEYMDFMRAQSVKGEDYGRLAGFFAKADPYIRREARALHEAEGAYARHGLLRRMDSKRKGERQANRDAFQRSFVQGKTGIARHDRALDQFMDHAIKFLGETVKPNTTAGRWVGRTILFHNWVGHMMKLMLYTMPLKHPRRTMLLNTLAIYGDQYRREHGAWPSWMGEMIPLNHWKFWLPTAQGKKLQQYTDAYTTNPLMPQSTAGGLLETLLGGDNKIAMERLAGLLAPPWQQLANTGIQEAKNAGLPRGAHVPSVWGTLEHQALGIIPGERKLFPETGHEADSTPWNEILRSYSSGVPGRPLPHWLVDRPTAVGGVMGPIERAFGFGGYHVPNDGPINTIENSKMIRHYGKEYRAQINQARTDRRKKLIQKKLDDMSPFNG